MPPRSAGPPNVEQQACRETGDLQLLPISGVEIHPEVAKFKLPV